MTRPAYIYLLPIYILFWILRYFINREEQKQAIIGFVTCTFCVGVILGYCGLMKVQHGEFEMTQITRINNAVTIIKSQAYKNASNQEIVKTIDDMLSKGSTEHRYWYAWMKIEDAYPKEEREEFLNDVITNNKDVVMKYYLDRIIKIRSIIYRNIIIY